MLQATNKKEQKSIFKVFSKVRHWPHLLGLLVISILMSGCYLPARFDAEVELSRTGFYSVDFTGYLAKVQLYADLKEGKLTPAQEKERVAILERDFKRDGATEEFSYFKQGHFKVHWQKKGDLIKAGSVVVFRRNENILSLTYGRETGLITIRGKYIRPVDADRLRDMGLWMEGEFRVKTDAKVVNHNATKVIRGIGGDKDTYVWTIKGPYDPAPKIDMTLY